MPSNTSPRSLAAAGLPGDPTAAGTGAAGGAGFGFQAAFGARIEPGADFLAELTELDLAIADADVLLSGEGRFDDQSLTGKVVGQLLERAAKSGVVAGVIAGQVTATTDVWTASLVDLAGSVEAAMAEPLRWLHDAGAEAARTLGEAQSLASVTLEELVQLPVVHAGEGARRQRRQDVRVQLRTRPRLAVPALLQRGLRAAAA